MSGREVAGPAASTIALDSIPDSLMKEARRTTQIQSHLHALLQEERPLKLVANPLLQFRNVNLTPEEAFIFSRVSEVRLPREIFAVSPLSEEETARALLGFLRSGLVGFADETISGSSTASAGSSKPAPAKGDLLEPAEIQGLFARVQNEDDWQVLDLRSGASSEEIKQAFQARAFRYHPDRYDLTNDEDLEEKLTYLFRRVTDAFAKLSMA